jgi:hypothetical protein
MKSLWDDSPAADTGYGVTPPAATQENAYGTIGGDALVTSDFGMQDAQQMALNSHTDNVTLKELNIVQGQIEQRVAELMAGNPNLSGKELEDQVRALVPASQNIPAAYFTQAVQQAEAKNQSLDSYMNKTPNGASLAKEEEGTGLASLFMAAPLAGAAYVGANAMNSPLNTEAALSSSTLAKKTEIEEFGNGVSAESISNTKKNMGWLPSLASCSQDALDKVIEKLSGVFKGKDVNPNAQNMSLASLGELVPNAPAGQGKGIQQGLSGGNVRQLA